MKIIIEFLVFFSVTEYTFSILVFNQTIKIKPQKSNHQHIRKNKILQINFKIKKWLYIFSKFHKKPKRNIIGKMYLQERKTEGEGTFTKIIKLKQSVD